VGGEDRRRGEKERLEMDRRGGEGGEVGEEEVGEAKVEERGEVEEVGGEEKKKWEGSRRCGTLSSQRFSR
jgi:hypothetical protein